MFHRGPKSLRNQVFVETGSIPGHLEYESEITMSVPCLRSEEYFVLLKGRGIPIAAQGLAIRSGVASCIGVAPIVSQVAGTDKAGMLAQYQESIIEFPFHYRHSFMVVSLTEQTR
jgi:hypothetical protein